MSKLSWNETVNGTTRMPLTVYVLRSETTGKTYVGQTNDLPKRIAQHNDPDFRLTLHTKRNAGPWVIIHSEDYNTRLEAMRREKYLKSGQGREWLRANLPGADAFCC